MANWTRTLILGLYIVAASTGGAYFINLVLAAIEALYGLSRVSIYSPPASLVINAISSSFISGANSLARFAASREFTSIQLLIFAGLIALASRFALCRQNPGSLRTAILASLFILPGVLILKVTGPIYLSYRVPGVIWAPFSIQDTALQLLLSVPFYALLFHTGALIVSGDRHHSAVSGNRYI